MKKPQVTPSGDLVYADQRVNIDRSNFNPRYTEKARIYVIAQMISEGYTNRQIHEKLETEWGVSWNFINGMINDAINEFKSDEIYQHIKEINNERLTEIYQKCKEKGDTKNALKAIDLLNKTNGVYDEQKTEVNIQANDKDIKITFGGEEI